LKRETWRGNTSRDYPQSVLVRSLDWARGQRKGKIAAKGRYGIREGPEEKEEQRVRKTTRNKKKDALVYGGL